MAEALDPPRAPPPPLGLLIALAAFGPMSIDLYLPSLPRMMQVFGTDVSHVQLTLSVYLAGFALAQLVYGPLSDRYGRRPLLLAGIVIYGLASVLCFCAVSVQMLILARFLQALGACAGPVLARAIVRDSFARDQAARVMASMASVMALAPAVAPMVGGHLLVLFGWRANFALLIGFSLVMLLLIGLALRETNLHPNPHALHLSTLVRNYFSLLGNRSFMGYCLTISFTFSAMFAFISGASFVIIGLLRVAPEHFGYCFLGVVAGFMAGSIIAARLGHRLGLEGMVAAGALIGLAAGLALLGLVLAGRVSVVSVVLPMAGIFLAAGIVLPNCTALAIAPHARIAGSASALLGFIQMSVASLMGGLVGRLDNGTALPMAAMVAGCAALAALVRWRLAGDGRAG